MRIRRQSGAERTGVLRFRLISSILVAALLPFAAAYWIANEYVGQQARADDNVRLSFTARTASRDASRLLNASRARAVALARKPALQRAALARDRAAIASLLRPGEVVELPVGPDVGRPRPGVPRVRIRVRTGNRLLATVAVSAPAGTALYTAARDAALPGTGDVLAFARGPRVVAGPPSVLGALFDGSSLRLRDGRTLHAQAVALAGYSPSAMIIAAADDSIGRGEQADLRRRLAIAALVSLVSICLYATALARPLLRSVDRVASVAEQAMIDPLTGVSNRRGFERALTVELERSMRRGHPLALVIADLDDFKAVNDRYGHDAGDVVLIRLADGLRAAVRSADTVARLGGEEFALLLPETTLEGALAVAERARISFEASDVHPRGGESLNVTASFGVADFPASADRGSLLYDADQALYAAKHLGKNRVAAAPRVVEAV